MPNTKRVQQAIDIMRRAKNLSMERYQFPSGDLDRFVYTEKELHACGNSACFAGYVALSSEFQADGGIMSQEGAPIFNEKSGEDALALWLEITNDLAYDLVYGSELRTEDFYPVEFAKVKPHHVIEKLELILAGELV